MSYEEKTFYYCSSCKREVPNGAICACHIVMPRPTISLDTYIRLQAEAGISQKSIHGHWDIYDAKERIDRILDLNGVKVG